MIVELWRVVGRNFLHIKEKNVVRLLEGAPEREEVCGGGYVRDKKSTKKSPPKRWALIVEL